MNNKRREEKWERPEIIAASKRNFTSNHQRVKVQTQQQELKTRKFSPIIAIEPYIIQVVSHLAKMLTPNSVYTGLLLVNSIIMDTLTYDSFLEWKQIHQPHCSLRNTRKCALGTGYWRGFMKRNKHLVILGMEALEDMVWKKGLRRRNMRTLIRNLTNGA